MKMHRTIADHRPMRPLAVSAAFAAGSSEALRDAHDLSASLADRMSPACSGCVPIALEWSPAEAPDGVPDRRAAAGFEGMTP